MDSVPIRRRQISSDLPSGSGENSPSRPGMRSTGGYVGYVILLSCLIGVGLLYLSEHRTRRTVEANYLQTADYLHAHIKEMESSHAAEMKHIQESVPANLRPCPRCPDCPKDKAKDKASGDLEATRKSIYEIRNKRLSDAMQLLAREMLTLKYGAGPHFVDLKLQLPKQVSDGSSATLRLEMAPADLMPVAVLYFLNLVASGAWNGCSFHRNAGHVLQATNMGEQCSKTLFQLPGGKGGDLSIPFQEYSASYPHVPFSVGLAGRPGGPDFYINLVDNVRAHGPGGQKSYDLESEADSCFAKVITGLDFIPKMHALPLDPTDKGYNMLKHLVTIVSAELVKKTAS